jgi:hypothetical protein
MGMFSVVLIGHDGLNQIEHDKDFGKNLGEAINEKRNSPNKIVPIPAGNYGNPAAVISHCFHGSELQIIVIEGGTGWVANGREKPSWSKVTQEMIKQRFSGVK